MGRRLGRDRGIAQRRRRVRALKTRLEPRGGLVSAQVEQLLTPRSTNEAVQAFSLATSGDLGPIALAGARRSFEAHFVPPGDRGVVISSKELCGIESSSRADGGVLRVRALAGTSFGGLLAGVNSGERNYMPFSAPTAEAISLGGALAANTHSRSSATYGGFFADRVLWFRLVAPSGKVYDCHEHASGELERRLYRYVPGSLGALGLVTELELELCETPADAEVTVSVIDERVADPLGTIDSYSRAARDNHSEAGFCFGEGVGAIFLGAPRAGRSFVLARRRSERPRPRRRTLPLFDDRPTRNAVVQALLHRFPALGQGITARLLKQGRAFHSRYYRWIFFQSSWDDAVERLGRGGAGWRLLERVVGVDRRLRLVHQSWVIPDAGLRRFMEIYFALLESERYRFLPRHFELQDLIPVPQSRWPLSPSSRHAGLSHVLTLNCPARTPSIEQAARAFCRDVSRLTHEAELGAVVHLIKQLHVADALLREMHALPLAELRTLKREVDPQFVLRSRTLERLGVCAT